MILPFALQKRIVTFLSLLPNIHDSHSQQAFINSAGLDIELHNQIIFGGSKAEFIQLLVVLLLDYGILEDGRESIEAILKTSYNYIGKDHQIECNALLHEINKFPKSKKRKTFAGRVVNFVFSKDEKRELRNRQIMLERMRQFWIEGVLEKALHNAVLLQVGKQEQPGFVEHVWDMQLQETAERVPRPVPREKPMIDVFEETGRSLLILGEPGAGKTITLLELTRDAIIRAEYEPSLPIPVIFNLSSWTERIHTLIDWLIEELNLKYQVPKKVGKQWQDENKLLLLLDGLDEVAQTSRNACVNAINAFRQEYGFTDMVVCSRFEEYHNLSERLNLKSAILLQMLTTVQIDAYLAKLGDALISLRTVMKEEVVFQELATSPLMLNIMVMAYHDVTIDELRTPDPSTKLFSLYIERMFKRRGIHKRYTKEQTIQWLSWLARNLSCHDQSQFFFENLKPTWLSSGRHRILYDISVRMFIGLLLGSSFYLGVLMAAIITGIPFKKGIIHSLLSILIVFFFTSCFAIKLSKWLSLAGGIIVSVSITTYIFQNLNLSIINGFIFGVIGGIVGMSIADRDEIILADKMEWSWRRGMLGVVLGVIIGVIGGRIITWINPMVRWEVSVELAFPFMLIFLIILGMTKKDALDQRVAPNQGVRDAAKISIKVGMFVVSIFFMYAFIVYISGHESWRKAVFWAMELSLIIGIVMSFVKNGAACVQHVILRAILGLRGYIPWNLTQFLDEAVENIFLYRIGGGYIFIHRQLLEYFSSKESDL